MSDVSPARALGIDFGTSNSAIAIPRALTEGPGMRLVPLEGEHLTSALKIEGGQMTLNGKPMALPMAALQ